MPPGPPPHTFRNTVLLTGKFAGTHHLYHTGPSIAPVQTGPLPIELLLELVMGVWYASGFAISQSEKGFMYATEEVTQGFICVAAGAAATGDAITKYNCPVVSPVTVNCPVGEPVASNVPQAIRFKLPGVPEKTT